MQIKSNSESIIKGNSFEIEDKLKLLETNSDPIMKQVLEEISYAVYLELKEATPVGDDNFNYFEKGELKDSWYVHEISDNTFEIGNPKEYILFVEFGLNKLSTDKTKRYNSLKYLYAMGVFDNKTHEYMYQANKKVKQTGFIRLILKQWDMRIKKTIIKLVGKQLQEFYKSL